MAHVEQQLISKIIRTGRLGEVLEWGIQEDDFRTSEGRGVYVHLLGYAASVDTRGAIPGINSFQSIYPTFELCDDASMTVEALCAEVRRNRIAGEFKQLLQEAAENIDIDPMGTVGMVRDQTHMLCTLGMKSCDDPMSSAVDREVERYLSAEAGDYYSGIQWPWQPFNDQTGGIQSDDYIVIYGRPKSKKSFVLGEMMATCYDQGLCILVYTKEMPTWQLHRRNLGFIARLPYDEMRMGRLSPELKRAFMGTRDMIVDQAARTHGRHNIIGISGKDAPAGRDSISWLRGKIEKYQPDIVFIDGLYLMSSDRKSGKDSDRVMQISRACRQMVIDMKVPVVATMQANRAAAKNTNAELDEIAYSDAIGQDVTVAIRVINEKISSPPTCALVVGGSREFELHGIRIGGMPCTDFKFKELMSERDVEKAKKKDTADDDSGRKKGDVKPLARTPTNNQTNGHTTKSTLNDQLATVHVA